MAISRNLEKTFQQLKDSLPKIIDQVQLYVDIADELDKVMSQAIAIKVKVKKKNSDDIAQISEGLSEHEGHLRECEKALEDISELILRMDKILSTEQKTREMDIIRKSYQLQQNILLDAIARIKKRFSELAAGSMPSDAELNTKYVIKKLEFYLAKDVELEISNDIRRGNNKTAFVKSVAISSPKNKTKVFVCISSNYNISKNTFDPLLTSFFVEVRARPPYEEGKNTWLSKGFEFDSNRIFALMLYHDLHSLIEKFPSEFEKFFKAPTARLKKFLEESDFIYKVGPAAGKGPIATFFIKPEHIEITKEGIPTGQISSPKENAILAKIRNIYPARKGIEMGKQWEKVTLRNVGGTKEPIYKLTIKFFPPGLSKIALGN